MTTRDNDQQDPQRRTGGGVKARPGKLAPATMNNIKLMIAAASLAGTVGGWAALAGPDGVGAMAPPPQALVTAPAGTTTAGATATVTLQATATATLTATPTTEPSATATATTASTAPGSTEPTAEPTATATTEPTATATTEPTATATATATAVPQRPQATTRSSR